MNANQTAKFNPVIPEGDYIVQGIVPGQGENPGLRKELREFKKDKNLWNLYLLGLWEFQRLDQDHQLSYLQLAGIHGLPYQAWPKNDPLLEDDKVKKSETGFCTHTSILFLSWHRPYLALFESVLQQAMLYVAKQYTSDEDWACTNLAVFPDEAIDSDTVSVAMPKRMREAHPELKQIGGDLVEIPNPLYAYNFQDNTDEGIKVNKRARTTRYDLAGSEELSAKEKREKLFGKITPITRELNQNIPIEGNLGERVMYLLQAYESFRAFSHNKWGPKRLPENIRSRRPIVNGPGFGSIEDIHNTLHGLVGGTGDYLGHMGMIAKSAFDPIFWLHHTNIDRLVAIWQGLHDDPSKPDDTWVTPEASERSTWVTKKGEFEGLDTPNHVVGFKGNEEYRKDIREKLLKLYPLTTLESLIRDFLAGNHKPEIELKDRAKRLVQISAVEQPTALTALSLVQATSEGADLKPSFADMLPPVRLPAVKMPPDRSLSTLAKNMKYLEWLFNIKAEKHSLGGDYLVHVFLGPVPRDEPTHLYTASPYHVGTFAPLGQSSDTACGKCQHDQAAHTEITGQIPLTIALVERYFAGLLDSLSEDDVVEYLKVNLHWEVIDASGTRRERERNVVDGLLVGVSSNEVTIPQNQHDLPHYSPEITLYPEITTKLDGENGRAEGTGITAGNIFTSSL